MPRKNENPIRSLFLIDEKSNKSICSIKNCNLGTIHSGNLEAHVKLHHAAEYPVFLEEKDRDSRKRKAKDDVAKLVLKIV